MNLAINRSVALLGTGSYLPARVITNDQLRGWCSNYDEEHSGDFGTWVDRVTHIHQRHYIEEGETAAHMGAEAARRALDMAGVKSTELDFIIHASFTPACCVPGDHVVLADMIGAYATPSITLTGACSGSVYGMAMAYGMLASGMMKRVLIVGSETISPTLDYSDPLTSILFADGAGAVVLGAVDGSEGGMLPPNLGFEYNYENIRMDNANLPFTSKVVVPAQNGNPPAIEKVFLTMKAGPSVMRNAVNTMAGCVRKVLGVDKDGLAELLPRLRVVPHQANGRIVDGLTKKLGMDPFKVTKTIYRVGNVSAASNVIALDFAMRKGNLTVEREPETERILAIHEHDDPIQRGDLVVLPTIGAGYLYGAVGFVSTIRT